MPMPTSSGSKKIETQFQEEDTQDDFTKVKGTIQRHTIRTTPFWSNRRDKTLIKGHEGNTVRKEKGGGGKKGSPEQRTLPNHPG